MLIGEEGSCLRKANCLLMESSGGSSLESLHSVGGRGGAEAGEFKSNLGYSVSICQCSNKNTTGLGMNY